MTPNTYAPSADDTTAAGYDAADYPNADDYDADDPKSIHI